MYCDKFFVLLHLLFSSQVVWQYKPGGVHNSSKTVGTYSKCFAFVYLTSKLCVSCVFVLRVCVYVCVRVAWHEKYDSYENCWCDLKLAFCKCDARVCLGKVYRYTVLYNFFSSFLSHGACRVNNYCDCSIIKDAGVTVVLFVISNPFTTLSVQ